jgi:hypothetical protein
MRPAEVGESMARWQFKEKAPLSVTVVMVLFLVVIVLNIAAAWGIPEWCPTVPDAAHTVPIRYRGGATYFVQPWLARATHDGDWLAIGLGATCFVLFILHRDKLERLR